MAANPAIKNQTTVFAPPWLERDKQAIEQALLRLPESHSRQIVPLIRHLYQSGGKRLRPLLTATVMRSLGADPADHFQSIVVSEMVHTASLIHDDLVDNTPLRRGRPAAHIAFDSKTAVLAGDFLLSHAIRSINDTGKAELLDMASGTIQDLVDGEVYETECNFDSSLTVETVRSIHLLKTGALFGYSAGAGAILAEADDETIEQAHRFGTAIGMAFQAVDDLLDWTGDSTVVGKPLGRDILEGKLNLPTAFGAHLDPFLRKSIGYFWECPETEKREFLTAIKSRIEKSGAYEQTRKIAAKDVADATTSIDAWPVGPKRDFLIETAKSIISRDF